MQFLPTFFLSSGDVSGTKQGFGVIRQQSGSSSFSDLMQSAFSGSDGKGLSQARGLLEAKAAALSGEDGQGLSQARGLLSRASSATQQDASSQSAPSSSFAAFAATASASASGTSSETGESASGAKKLLSALLTAANGTGKKANLDMQSLTVTREDFAALREGLAKYGFTSQELEELQAMVNSQGGLTWGKLVSVTSRKMAGLDAFPTELSQSQVLSISSFLQKAGCTPQEADDLIEKLNQGESAAVLQALDGKLAALPEDSTLDLDSDEIEALCSALGLDATQKGRLRSSIAENGAATLASKDLKAVLSELKTDKAQAQADQASTATALRDLVATAFEGAREKAGVHAQADRRPDDEARRSRILAEAAEDEREAKENEYRPLSGKHVEDEGESTGLSSRLPGSGESRLAGKAETSQDGGKNSAGQGRNQDAGSQVGEQAAAQGAKADTRTDDQKAWAEFWSKVAQDRTGQGEAKTEAKATQNPAILAAESAAKAETAAVNASSSLEKFSPRDVLRQVESGIYRSQGEGAKQLTLRLDPPELGKLNLQLTVRGQEVNVVLKAETADAGHVLQENLQQLRQNLEAMGLKVGKMEVQTQLSGGDSNQNWSGTDRHNEARERDETSRALDRMRILRGEAATAQDIAPADATALPSQAGLSVIA